jgi:hypothetical protein
MTPKARKGCAIVCFALLVFPVIGYFGSSYVLGRALETKGIRKLIAAKTAKLLDAPAGYLPLASNGMSISSRGFLAKAEPPHALTEMRAARLSARCNLAELWRGKWKIDNLAVDHLQAAFGTAAAQVINHNEFSDPELAPRSQTEAPLDVDIHKIDIFHTDLFWGGAPNEGGEFRDVHTNFFPREGKLFIEGAGGTFRQAKWPVAQVQKFKLLYAKPELRIDEAAFTLGGASSISALGNFRFEQQAGFDFQLTFAHCPVAPFLSEEQRSKLEGEFDGNAHLQKQIGQSDSARVAGSIAMAKAILKNVEALQNVANFTGRNELARLPISQVKADYDWTAPTLTVKNFVLESKELVVVKGEFTLKEKKLNGEFQLGVAPDLVEKFPGASEEVFKRSEDGYLWTDLALSGSVDNLHDNLKPRLVRAAQNHFAKGLLAPILKPGQTIIQAIEAL